MAQHLHTETVHRNPWLKQVLGCLMAVVLVACGGGDPTTGSPPAAMQPTTVTGADGASMDFTPAEGLLPAPLTITRAGAGAPTLPPGMEAAGAVYQFAPLGHVGSAVEIRVPFDGAQPSNGAPRLLVTLPGEGSWSEVDAQLEGTMLRARVPALGYAVAARPLSAAGAERQTASTVQPAQYLRGQLSAEPPLQGSGFLLTATAPSTATIRLDYSFAQSCAAPVQLRLRALVARSPSSTLPFSVRTVDLGSRGLTARAGSESFELPLTAANNGTWVFLADARCIEQGRVRFGVLTALPVLVVKIVNAPPPPPAEGSATIGAAGGFVNGPDGVRLAVPPAALEADITFRIARESSGAPPLPAGIDLASAVYAITPHGQLFAVSASVELPVSAALAAGRPTFLMKAEPGGRWSVIASDNGAVTTLRAGIDSLSYLAVGVCQDNLPAGSLFAQACPSSNQLGLELLLNGTTPVPISQDTTYGAPIPVVLVTTPETLTFRMTWTRPAGTNRVDTLDTGTGLSGSTVVRQAGFTFATVAPRFLQVNENSFSRTFTVDVDPTRVSGATGPNGVVRRIWAQAAFAVIGPGNVGSANWEFNAWVPIQVRSVAPVPAIDSQPANVGVNDGQPATFSVAASVSPAATLSYQWARRAGAGGSFAPIAGATAPSYTLPVAQLADNGAQFQVEVCATRCVTSNLATLTVTQTAEVPSFTVQPSDIGVLSGQTASFNVTAGGRPLPRIDWQSAPASDPNNFTAIAGVAACARTHPPSSGSSTAASCTVGPLAMGDSGRRYRAVATNSASSTNSVVATVTVNAAPVAPNITQEPQPQTTAVGGSATFNVKATGTALLTYAWGTTGGGNISTTNGSRLDLPGIGCSARVSYSDGGATLTLSELTIGCNGLVVVVTVSNGIGGANSNGATLTVTAGSAPPTFVLLPTAQAVDIGQSATFSVQASGANLTYQWLSARPGNVNVDTGEVDSYGLFEDIPGATASSYTTPPATISDDQMLFAVRVCSGPAQPPTYPNCYFYGILTTDGVRLTINPVVSQNFGTVVSGTQATLNSVAFATPSIGVAVGEAGTILRTDNAGQTWAPIVSGTTANLRAVAFAPGGTGRGVVTGENGLLFTADFGATWTATLPGDNGVCCIDVAFADATTAVASYRDGFVRSITEGQSFMQVFRITVSSPVVRFGSATNGAAADGRILYTTDGGLNWSVATQPSTIGAKTLAFANDTVAVASSGGALMRTINGGQAWSALYEGRYTRYTNSLAFNSSGVGLALGEGPSFSAMRTHDRGVTWVPLSLPGLSGRINGVAFADANVAIAVGAVGTIVRFTLAGL